MNPVNGCSVTCNYARPDFHMAAPLEKEVLAAEIGAVIARIEKKSAMTLASRARVRRAPLPARTDCNACRPQRRLRPPACV
jgi:hypothetical protein